MKKYVIILSLFLLPLILKGQETTEDKLLTIKPPIGGIKNDIPADVIPPIYSPDLANIRINKAGSVTKRNGSQTYDNVAPIHTGDILGLYEHWQSNGTRYFLKVAGSTLAYSVGDGNWAVLVSTMNPNYIPDFCSFLDYAIITNGFDDVRFFKDGVVISSPAFTKFRYIDVYEERLWGSGVTGARSRLYYGSLNELFDPQFNSTYIGQDDGDFITGQKVYNGILWIFKNYSTWAAIWKYVYSIDQSAQFVVRNLSKEFGCLFDTSIQEFNGGLVFMSREGYVYMKSSSGGETQYKLISVNIDGDLKETYQVTANANFWEQTSAADFASGIGEHVDSTTVNGSVILSSYVFTTIEQGGAPVDANEEIRGTRFWQSFYSTYTINLASVAFTFGNVGVDTVGDLLTANLSRSHADGASPGVGISTRTYTALSGTFFNGKNLPMDLSLEGISLLAHTTYYIVVFSTNGSGANKVGAWSYSQTSTYPRGRASTNASYDFRFNIYSMAYNLHGYYASPVKFAEDDWLTWDIFESAGFLPAGTGLDWYVSCATASIFCSTSPTTEQGLGKQHFVKVTPGFAIASTTGPYILVFASMSTTGDYVNNTPELQSFTVNWDSDLATDPVPSIVYDDYYWTAISSGGMAMNGVCYLLDKNFAWYKDIYSGIFPFSMALYKDKPYFGSANDDGRIYKADIAGRYDDNGLAYSSYFRTSDNDCGAPYNEKEFIKSFTRVANSGNWNLSWGYGLNNTTTAITTDKDVFLGQGDRTIVDKANFPNSTKGYSIKFEFINNTTNQFYDWKDMGVYYDILPTR